MGMSYDDWSKMMPIEQELSKGWMVNPEMSKTIDKRVRMILPFMNICRSEYFKIHFGDSNDAFYHYLECEHGIKMLFNDQGMILPTFDIVNEKKFLMFKLKYSHD